MKSKLNIFGILLFTLFLLSSCASRRKIAYLQDVDNKKGSNSESNYEPKLQPDDRLSIIISAENPELTIPFNMPQIQTNYDPEKNQEDIKTYLIDNKGYINYPVIGLIKLAGFTRNEASKELEKKISEYIKDPTVNINIMNFKVSVLGEVAKPVSQTIPSERITLIEALSLAGDLTIYGRRDNILVIREVDGKKSYNRVDITKSDFINSPYYYLSQNDVIYVEPNKTKVNSSAYGPNIPAIIASISLLTSITILLLRK